MDDFRADLHCHSLFSDGSDTPEELLELAKEKGLKGLSITDHDTTRGYTPELFAKAKQLGVELLTGVEISAEFDTSSVHILGYGVDVENEKLQSFLSGIQTKRAERNQKILEKLSQHNMPIEEEELLEFAKNRTVGRPHIAQLMVQKGYVFTIREAFEVYLKEGGTCYTPGMKFSPKDVIEVIHQARGKAVLAHPHFYKRRNFIKKLLTFDFDGYECYYSRLDRTIEQPWIDRAKEKGVFATGGSDYHGSFKPFITLGASWTNFETFSQLTKERS